MKSHRPNKLSQGDRSEIKEAWVYGIDGKAVTGLDLAVEYDVSVPAITYHTKGLKRLVTPRMGSPRTFDHGRARALKAAGLSYRAVARRLGVTYTRVWQVVNQQEDA